MFKSKSSRLACRLARQQAEEEEAAAAAARAAALPKQDYLDNCHCTYSCIHCRAHLANHDELISKLFQGNQGRAYLFNRVVNVGCKRAITRELLTGLHAVCDIYCKTCETTLGWKYETAFVPSQRYKEGKFIIELVHMIKENNSDPGSFARVKKLFHGATRQQVPAYEQIYLTPCLGAAGDEAAWAAAPPAAKKQQLRAHNNSNKRNIGTCRDRSSSSSNSISIYRNGPALAGNTATRRRAPSMPNAATVATCAGGQQEEEATREHVAVEMARNQHANETTESEAYELGAETSDQSQLPVETSNLRVASPPPPPPSNVVVVLREVQALRVNSGKDINTHRTQDEFISSSPNLTGLVAPTSGCGDGATRGSSETSSQLSSASVSSSSLALEHHPGHQPALMVIVGAASPQSSAGNE